MHSTMGGGMLPPPATASTLRSAAVVYGATFAPLTSSYANAQPAQYWGRYLRRGLAPSSWDLEYVAYQLFYACRSPSKVYKLTQHRKQTKNQWARDDPAFVLVLAGFLGIAAIAYGIAYEYSPFTLLWLVVQAWAAFAVSGTLLASACWAVANKYMRSSVPLPHSVEQEVEWLYAWDVHCNAYVPILALLCVTQFFLLPVILVDGFLPTLLGNSLYAAALMQYVYITFSGYLILPFLQRQNLFLSPMVVIIILYLLLTVLNYNIGRHLLGLVFE